ncbi:NADH-ubiquinone oxidoreductase chain 2, partial [Bienertia sinuspersici]
SDHEDTRVDTKHPMVHSGGIQNKMKLDQWLNVSANSIQIDEGVNEEEVSFWASSIVCYVLGVNPPLEGMDGFMHQWIVDMDVPKDDHKIVPIWIKFPKLYIKYWGIRLLNKIVRMVGDFIKGDVEVRIYQLLPNSISFINEKGVDVEKIVKYEWRPLVCTTCKCLGHQDDNCRKVKTKRWV